MSEEGIGVDAPEDDDDEDMDTELGDARIAEAKPVGKYKNKHNEHILLKCIPLKDKS